MQGIRAPTIYFTGGYAMNQTLRKRYAGNVDMKIVDEQSMIIDHCISDEAEDRDGDIIPLTAWDFGNYMHNPIVLESHDMFSLPVGKCIELYNSGNQLRAKTQFAPTERGRALYTLYKEGFMHAFSVQFIEAQSKINASALVRGGKLIEKAELLEYSCVTVPANPRALKSLEDQAWLANLFEALSGNPERLAAVVAALDVDVPPKSIADGTGEAAEPEPPVPEPTLEPIPDPEPAPDGPLLVLEALKNNRQQEV